MQRTHGRPLVTPAFHPLADFADFGDAEAQMLRDCTSRRLPYTQAVASAVVDELFPPSRRRRRGRRREPGGGGDLASPQQYGSVSTPTLLISCDASRTSRVGQPSPG